MLGFVWWNRDFSKRYKRKTKNDFSERPARAPGCTHDASSRSSPRLSIGPTPSPAPTNPAAEKDITHNSVFRKTIGRRMWEENVGGACRHEAQACPASHIAADRSGNPQRTRPAIVWRRIRTKGRGERRVERSRRFTISGSPRIVRDDDPTFGSYLRPALAMTQDGIVNLSKLRAEEGRLPETPGQAIASVEEISRQAAKAPWREARRQSALAEPG